MAEKFWKNLVAKRLKNDNYEILLSRSDDKIIAIEVSAIPIGDLGLIKALECAERHRNCDCEIGRYKEHREFRRKK